MEVTEAETREVRGKRHATNVGLHAYYLELVSMDLEHLGPF